METQQQERQEHGSVTAFFADLAKTRERFDWQTGGANMCAPIRAVPKGARLRDHNLPCDCPMVAVAKLRATSVMGGWPTAFHVSNGSAPAELARACNVSVAFAEDVMYAADAEVIVDEDGDEVPIYSPELRDRLLRTVGIIEA